MPERNGGGRWCLQRPAERDLDVVIRHPGAPGHVYTATRGVHARGSPYHTTLILRAAAGSHTPLFGEPQLARSRVRG